MGDYKEHMSEENQGSSAPQADTSSNDSLETTESTEGQEEGSQDSPATADLASAEAALKSKTATPKAKEEAKKVLRKFKLKVDGKDIEEEIDMDDNDYITKQLQLAKVSQKRMGEYSQLEKEVKSFIDELRKNPRKVLQDPTIGIDVKQLAAQIIEEEIENSKKSPEQLQREELEAKLKKLEDERREEKENSKKADFERLQSQEYERYDLLMTQALEKSDLPKSPYIVKKMADYMLLGLNNGVDVTPDDVIPLVRQEMTDDLREMFQVMPEEVIESIIGKDVINRIRKKSVAKAKAAPLKASAPDTGTTGKEKPEAGKKQSFKSFFGV